jgi:DinB family protein
VKPGEIADLLEASGQAFASTLDALPPEAAAWHPAPGEWCVNECVGHVIEAEKRGFAGRIKTILGADEPNLPGWDRVAIARERRDCARPPSELRDELLGIRRESVNMVRSLPPEQTERGGLHPEVGRLTVDELLHEWVHHDGNHLRQALANVQAYVWAKMGNAQRFSQPSK